MTSSRGFTLIELLVVIAIIGILASVVLASLGLSRAKGADASIKNSLHTIQTQMELYNTNNNNNYGTAVACQSSPATSVGSGSSVFITDPVINGALKSAMAQSGQGYWAVGANGQSYAVAFALKGDSTHWWCIDSTNQPTLEPAATMSGGSPLGGGTNTATCP